MGANLQAIGSSMRVLASWYPSRHDIWLLILGQILSSFAMPFVVNTPSLLSSSWFPAAERASATSTSVNANALGIAMVYFVAPMIVHEEADLVDWETTVAGTALVMAFITFCCFETRPKTWITSNEDVHLTADYDWHQWVDAFRHEGFWVTVVCFSVSECILNAFSSLLNIFLIPEGYSRQQIGTVGALFIISALIGSQIMSNVVGKTHAYKSVLQFSLFWTAICIAVFKLSLEVPGKVNTFVALMATGFFVGPLQSIVLELGVECAFPTSEATVAALQQLCGNLMSAILIPTLSYMHRHFKAKSGHVDEQHFYVCPEWIMVFLLMASSIAFLFFNGQHKRHLFESAQDTMTVTG